MPKKIIQNLDQVKISTFTTSFTWQVLFSSLLILSASFNMYKFSTIEEILTTVLQKPLTFLRSKGFKWKDHRPLQQQQIGDYKKSCPEMVNKLPLNLAQNAIVKIQL